MERAATRRSPHGGVPTDACLLEGRVWSEYGDRTWVWTSAGKPSLSSASRRQQPPRGTRSASTGSMLTASCLLSKPAHSVRPSTDAVRGSTRSSQRRWPAATPSCSSAESSGSAAVAARLSSPPTACPMSREERAVRRDQRAVRRQERGCGTTLAASRRAGGAKQRRRLPNAHLGRRPAHRRNGAELLQPAQQRIAPRRGGAVQPKGEGQRPPQRLGRRATPPRARLGAVSAVSRRGVVVVSRVSEAQRQRLGGAEAASRSSPRGRLATPRRARGAGRGSRRGRGPRRSRTCETRSRPPWTSASRATPRVECCAPSAAPSAAAPSADPGPWSEPPVARRPRPKAGPAPRPEEASHQCAARRAGDVLGAERWSENSRVPNATGSPADRPGPPESCRCRCAASSSSSPASPLLVPVPCRAAAAAHSRDRSAQLAAASLTAWTLARLVRLPSSWRGAWRHGYHRPAGRSCPAVLASTCWSDFFGEGGVCTCYVETRWDLHTSTHG